MNKKIHWENPHNDRYYEAHLHQDLLGDWLVRVCWGKKHTRLGKLKYVFCENENKAMRYLKKLSLVRTYHGYVFVDRNIL